LDSEATPIPVEMFNTNRWMPAAPLVHRDNCRAAVRALLDGLPDEFAPTCAIRKLMASINALHDKYDELAQHARDELVEKAKTQKLVDDLRAALNKVESEKAAARQLAESENAAARQLAESFKAREGTYQAKIERLEAQVGTLKDAHRRVKADKLRLVARRG